MKTKLCGLLLGVFGLVILPNLTFAHPGNTDSLGGHYCWTNCDKWGHSYGEYHFHEEKSKLGGIDLYFKTQAFVEKTKSNIRSYIQTYGGESLCEDDTIKKMTDYGFDSLKSNMKMLEDFKIIPEYHYCSEDYECSTNIKYLDDSNVLLSGVIGWLAATNDEYCGTNLQKGLIDEYINFVNEQNKKFTQPVVNNSKSSSSASFKKEPIKKSTPSKSVVKAKIKTSAKSSVSSAKTTQSKIACKKSGNMKTCMCPSGYKANRNASQCIRNTK